MNHNYVYVRDDVRVDTDELDIGLKLGEYWFSVQKIIETKIRIVYRDKTVGLLKLNKSQLKLYHAIAERLSKRLPLDFIILKARQLGFTTFIEAFIIVTTLFRANQEAVIIANTEENASKIFEKYKFSYQELKARTPQLAPTLQNQTGRILKTKTSNSSIRIAPSSVDAARGSTLSAFHGSECAFWANMDDVLAAVDAALPDVSINPVVFRFLESTANGYNTFKDYWDDAVKRFAKGEIGGAVPFFFPWFEDDANQNPYDGFQLSEFEQMKMQKHHLTLDQMTYWHRQLVKKKGDLSLTLQEYPFDPEDAFRSSGECVFDIEALSHRKQEVLRLRPQTKSITCQIHSINGDIEDWKMDKIALKDDLNGALTLYEEPVAGVPYCIGVDMAWGLSHDNSVAQVIRNDTKKQVAILSSNKIKAERYGELVAALGYYYNNALVGVETAATGETVISILKKLNYMNIYRRENDSTNVYNNLTEVYGVKTTKQSKNPMVTQCRYHCESYVEGRYRNVVDYDTLSEMEAFVYDYDNVKNDDDISTRAKMHGKGRHDDKVMALAIAYYISDQQKSYVEKEAEVEPEFRFPPELQTDDDDNYEVEDVWHLYYQ